MRGALTEDGLGLQVSVASGGYLGEVLVTGNHGSRRQNRAGKGV